MAETGEYSDPPQIANGLSEAERHIDLVVSGLNELSVAERALGEGVDLDRRLTVLINKLELGRHVLGAAAHPSERPPEYYLVFVDKAVETAEQLSDTNAHTETFASLITLMTQASRIYHRSTAGRPRNETAVFAGEGTLDIWPLSENRRAAIEYFARPETIGIPLRVSDIDIETLGYANQGAAKTALRNFTKLLDASSDPGHVALRQAFHTIEGSSPIAYILEQMPKQDLAAMVAGGKEGTWEASAASYLHLRACIANEAYEFDAEELELHSLDALRRLNAVLRRLGFMTLSYQERPSRGEVGVVLVEDQPYDVSGAPAWTVDMLHHMADTPNVANHGFGWAQQNGGHSTSFREMIENILRVHRPEHGVLEAIFTIPIGEHRWFGIGNPPFRSMQVEQKGMVQIVGGQPLMEPDTPEEEALQTDNETTEPLGQDTITPEYEPTMEVRDLDDGLVIRRDDDRIELLLDDELTDVSPLAALLIEALADQARARSSRFSLHSAFEAAVAELGLGDSAALEGDIRLEVRRFLEANDLDYLLDN